MTADRMKKVRRAMGIACLTLCVLWAATTVVMGLKAKPAPDAYAPLGRQTEIGPVRIATGGVIDPNTADVYELTELPGVGETTAQAIVDEREKNGPYYYPEDLIHAKGIGKKKLEGFYDWLDLSTDRDAAITEE